MREVNQFNVGDILTDIRKRKGIKNDKVRAKAKQAKKARRRNR